MKYYSTGDKQLAVSAATALLSGLAPDGGLFFPHSIPSFSSRELSEFHHLSYPELAAKILQPFFSPDIPDATLRTITEDAFPFPVPLRQIEPEVFALELFHGPTLAFKDFGARCLARMMSYLRRGESGELLVLVATSGDTGSAVANGFYRVPGVRVVILYPSGRVSPLQEQQLTTLGENITALEVQGSFDDCQGLVKEAFVDKTLKKALQLTSANSINIGRLLPQSIYFFWGYFQLQQNLKPTVFSVPSGNLGNLAAGVFAKRMGLPVKHFIAAMNINDSLVEYLRNGHFQPRSSVGTVSNAMDVGNPSNIARLFELYGHDVEAMRKGLFACSSSDEATVNEIRNCYQKNNYLLDPHGAVGMLALKEYRKIRPNCVGVVLETAHPAKFRETVEPASGTSITLPPALEASLHLKKRSVLLPANFDDFKDFLLNQSKKRPQ